MVYVEPKVIINFLEAGAGHKLVVQFSFWIIQKVFRLINKSIDRRLFGLINEFLGPVPQFPIEFRGQRLPVSHRRWHAVGRRD